MPLPSLNDVHVNRPLTQISIAYIQDQKQFIAGKIFPLIPVEAKSDIYVVYDKEDFLRDEAAERAPATESEGGGYAIDTSNYYTARVYAIHKDVDDQIRANSEKPLDPDRDATKWVTQKLLIKRERIWAANFFKTSVWGRDTTGNASPSGATQFKFWNVSGSDPLYDIDFQKSYVESLTGLKPNTLVVSGDVHTVLKNHSAVLDRIKYTQKGMVTEDLLAGLFGVDDYYVASAAYSTSKMGGTDATGYIFPEGAWLGYVAKSPGLYAPSAGYTFNWKGLLGGAGGKDSNWGIKMKNFRMEHLASDRIEGEMAFDMKKIAADLGVFFSNPIQ